MEEKPSFLKGEFQAYVCLKQEWENSDNYINY